MQPQQIHTFLSRFFRENDCAIIHESGQYIHVQLTVDMDKKIMNRPYYWQYIESVNEEPVPAQVTFITDRKQLDQRIYGEDIYFGSPRLSQLFHVTGEMGSFVQMYEQVPGAFTEKVMITPWLGINYKIAYCSHQTKEILYSLGMNLMTGAVVKEFQETVQARNVASSMAENTFHLPYIITPARALDRLDGIVDQIIEQDDHSWADEAIEKWQNDRAVLDYFYERQEVKPECYEVEKAAMEEQFNPRIQIEIVNGGLFYLK